MLYQEIFAQHTTSAKISIDKKGKMLVRESIEGVNAKDTLLLFTYIHLNKNDEILIGKDSKYRKQFYQYKNTDGKINFRINPPKTWRNQFFFQDSIFFISASYLGLIKEDFNRKKTFKLNIEIPDNYNLVYPKREDLEKEFYNAPPILFGKINEYEYNDYCVYIGANIKDYEQQVRKLVSVIDDAFTYFQTLFSKRKEHPEIVFLPFKNTLKGKNIDNLIVLNEKMLTEDKRVNEKTLIHEVLHLWWGPNSIKFENPILTEAITEFLTLDYLKLKKKNSRLKWEIETKNNKINGILNYDLRYDNVTTKKDYKTYCYNLLPLILWSNYKKVNIKNILIEFYSNNADSFVPYAEGNNLLKKMKVQVKGTLKSL